MKTLSRGKRVYVLDPQAKPAITIDSGEELMGRPVMPLKEYGTRMYWRPSL